jgi:hypothetical protein
LQGEQEWSAAAREQEQRILSLQQDSEELKLTMRHMQVSSPAVRVFWIRNASVSFDADLDFYVPSY